MKKIYLQKSLIIKFIFYILLKNTIQQELCSKDISCDNCQRCIITLGTESSCKYGNLFCKQEDSIYYLSELKSSYINYFNQNLEAANICGRQYIDINSKEFKKNIKIGKDDYLFLKTNSLHCNYDINNELFNDNHNDIYISLLLSNNNSIIHQILSFTIYFHFGNINNYFNENDIRNNKKLIKLNNIQMSYIMIDFDKIFIENEFEDLIIEIYITKNKNFNENENLPPAEKSDDQKKNKIYYVLFAGLAAIIILLIIVIKNCMKRRLYVNRDNNSNRLNNLNREDIIIHRNDNNNIIDNKKKIELLFNTQFYPIKYNKNMLGEENINCSICLENFKEGKSIIILTPCSHIFHFECLKKWGNESIEHFKCPNCNYDFLKEEENLVIKIDKKYDNNITNANNINYNDNYNYNNYNYNISSTTNRNFNREVLRSNNILSLNNNIV